MEEKDARESMVVASTSSLPLERRRQRQQRRPAGRPFVDNLFSRVCYECKRSGYQVIKGPDLRPSWHYIPDQNPDDGSYSLLYHTCWQRTIWYPRNLDKAEEYRRRKRQEAAKSG